MGKRCCFAGHGDFSYGEEEYEDLVEQIEKLILNENVTEFWVGNYGAFDRLAARAVKDLRKKYPHITLELVIPYLTVGISTDKEYYEAYDGILVADIPAHTPQRFRILKCNAYMVDKADFLLCYVRHGWGGAAQTLEYAQKKEYLTVLNLFDSIKKRM